MFESIPFWAGSIYVCFPLGLLLYGWNDIGDAESDRLNPRKDSWLFGARPDEKMRLRLPWLMAAIQMPFVIAFCILAGPKMLGWFLAVLATNAAYNQLAFKQIVVLDLINQVGYLLIFVLASWLCDVPQLSMPAMIFSALFAMQSHLFGQLMDIDEDRIAGRRSTAILMGVVRAKWLLTLIMVAESMIAFKYFRGWYVAIFMLVGAAFFFVDSLRGPQRYPTIFLKSFFVCWNMIVIGTMYFVWRYGVFLEPQAY